VVALCVAAYVAIAFSVYVHSRYWLPVAVPVLGAFLACLSLIAWRVVFEEAERRRVRSLFAKMVSPKIVNELLATKTLSLGGARREVTVFFADVRGFTQLTDSAEERAVEHVRRYNLTGAAAEACFNEHARQTLETVNLYLATVADLIIKNDGTLDKFIGDCVMAFWGAPTANPHHARACVHTAIQAQRAVYELNLRRVAENEKRQAENLTRTASGAELVPLLPVLTLGSGVNTGLAAAGLMGSAEAESLSYTVFGREVNLASRLEGASGRGRIFITQSTYQHLLRDDPALAQTCVLLEPVQMKGFRLPVTVYEVPWRLPGAEPLDLAAAAAESSVTGFFQRGTQ
jgi:adenylate cyclase